MLKTCFAAFFTLAIVLTLASQGIMAQSADGGMPMRTPDGQPDVSGVFTFRTLTPLQRPTQFEGQENLTAEDAAQFEASERTRQNRDLFDPEKGSGGYAPRAEGGVLSYNEFWYERGIELTSDKRTSLIIDPPDGRLPPQTEAASMAARERRTYTEAHRYDSYENRSWGDRCIMFSKSGPPIRNGAYNNNLMIFQTPRACGDSHRAGAPGADHPDRGHREAFVRAACGRVTRALGRGDAGHRDDPVPRPGEWGDRPEHAPGRTSDPTRSRHRRLRVHRHGSDGVYRALYGGGCRSGAPRTHSSNTRVTRATTASMAFSPGRACSN